MLILIILGTDDECTDHEPFCSDVDRDKDCCSELMQKKCPVKCNACPGAMIIGTIQIHLKTIYIRSSNINIPIYF